jgi:zinc transporter ZupT
MASSGLIAAKLVFFIIIFLVAFISGLLPAFIPWLHKNKKFLGIANAFSGGVFLAIAFTHILPEVSSQYSEYNEDDEEHHEEEEGAEEEDEGHDHDHPFPLPYVLVFVGYTLILLVDKVVFDTHQIHHHGTNSKSVKNEKEECKSEDLNQHIPQYQREYLSREEVFTIRMNDALEHTHNRRLQNKTFQNQDGRVQDEQDIKPDEEEATKKKIVLEENIYEEKVLSKWKKFFTLNLTPVVLMIALTVHSLFEGIATGLVDELSEIWTFFIAIILHKWAAAISLGISMSRNFENNKLTKWILLIIFSLATPLGVCIGMAISGSSDMAEIVFSSLAGGTFVYIA